MQSQQGRLDDGLGLRLTLTQSPFQILSNDFMDKATAAAGSGVVISLDRCATSLIAHSPAQPPDMVGHCG